MPAHDSSLIFVELGAIVVGLSLLARLASRARLPAIPLYLLAGLAFGRGGIAPLDLSEQFNQVGSEIGVLLLLFMLGLEYTGEQLGSSLKSGYAAGLLDFVLNFAPGFAAGLLLGWVPMAALLLGGVTWVSSSGVIAKLIGDLGRTACPETPSIVTVLVFEDLAMAVFLPVSAAAVAGGTAWQVLISVSIAIAAVMVVLLAAVRYGGAISRLLGHRSDEIVLLTAFGAVLLVAGLAQRMQVSAAVAAFLVGIAFSGPLAEQSHRLLAPLRDLFAATFFFFFGLQTDPSALIPQLLPAGVLAVVTALTKAGTGYWAARRAGLDAKAGRRAGAALIARGEFSIVIAGLGASLEPALAPLASAYVLLLAVTGPIIARVTD